MNKVELLEKISALATECHTLACELDIGDERTEMFEIYSVLHNLCRRGYASQVGRRMNPRSHPAMMKRMRKVTIGMRMTTDA